MAKYEITFTIESGLTANGVKQMVKDMFPLLDELTVEPIEEET